MQKDLSRFENPDFSASQMRLLIDLIRESRCVEYIANPDIPFQKMHVLSMGIKQGFDMSKYAHAYTSYSANKLLLILWGLEVGLDADVLFKTGYNAQQIDQIIQAAGNDLDTDILMNPEISADCMWMLNSVRECGLDISDMGETVDLTCADIVKGELVNRIKGYCITRAAEFLNVNRSLLSLRQIEQEYHSGNDENYYVPWYMEDMEDGLNDMEHLRYEIWLNGNPEAMGEVQIIHCNCCFFVYIGDVDIMDDSDVDIMDDSDFLD